MAAVLLRVSDSSARSLLQHRSDRLFSSATLAHGMQANEQANGNIMLVHDVGGMAMNASMMGEAVAPSNELGSANVTGEHTDAETIVDNAPG